MDAENRLTNQQRTSDQEHETGPPGGKAGGATSHPVAGAGSEAGIDNTYATPGGPDLQAAQPRAGSQRQGVLWDQSKGMRPQAEAAQPGPSTALGTTEQQAADLGIVQGVAAKDQQLSRDELVRKGMIDDTTGRNQEGPFSKD